MRHPDEHVRGDHRAGRRQPRLRGGRRAGRDPDLRPDRAGRLRRPGAHPGAGDRDEPARRWLRPGAQHGRGARRTGSGELADPRESTPDLRGPPVRAGRLEGLCGLDERAACCLRLTGVGVGPRAQHVRLAAGVGGQRGAGEGGLDEGAGPGRVRVDDPLGLQQTQARRGRWCCRPGRARGRRSR
ncbi:hypothetical protein [Nocardioides convexus]|uniref:hypothetical protein n=1 Tax=Nocardioides convexus TaxID=2712224 RepID=UPI0024183E7B|nr:hypothetical protein [Nocardioides convexus]